MEMHYTIDTQRKLIIATWQGRHDPLVVQNYVKELLADERLIGGLSYVSDQRGLDTLPTTVRIETGVIFLEMFLSKFGPFKYAIISKEGNIYDLQHMQSLMEPIPDVQIAEFTQLDEALSWAATNN